MEKRIEALRPEAQPVCREWEARCKEAGLDARITETFRSPERQASLQSTGASSVKFGWHNVGLAWDYGCYDEHGAYIQSGADARYAKCGAIAVSLGCKWPIHLANGNIDAGHIEFHPGFTLSQYLANVAQGSVKAWTPPPKEEVR